MASFKEFRRKLRKAVKVKLNQRKIHIRDFSIISNNCWGTRIYQRFGLPYLSPFSNLFIFAPDYIALLEGFSPAKLNLVKFIPHDKSKYKNELIEQKLFGTSYPIGVLVDGTELHFIHYDSAEDAKDKWDRRIKRINFDKLIFKFSDGYNATDELIERFDRLVLKNKICFTSKSYPGLKSIVYMDKFRGCERVELEWKYDQRYINIPKFINSLECTGTSYVSEFDKA